MENGRARQEGISVAEVLVLADALDVPPALIVFPLEGQGTVEVLPGREMTAWAAYRWFCGDVVSIPGLQNTEAPPPR